MSFGLAVEELILGSQVETMTNKEVAEHVHVFVRVSPELAFQVVDLLAEGWLRNVQPIRCVGEIQLLGGKRRSIQDGGTPWVGGYYSKRR
jgi:hypothetical protein